MSFHEDFPFLNAREDISAILFSSPAMDIGVSDHACVWWIRIPNMRKRHVAGIYLLARSLYAHFTADVLSQKNLTCAIFRDRVICSRTRKLRNSAASSKSLIVMSPLFIYVGA